MFNPIQTSRYTVPVALLYSPHLSPRMKTHSPSSVENPRRLDTVGAQSLHAVADNEVPDRTLGVVAYSFSALGVVVSKATEDTTAAVVVLMRLAVAASDGKTTTSRLVTATLLSTSKQTGSYWKRLTSTDLPS